MLLFYLNNEMDWWNPRKQVTFFCWNLRIFMTEEWKGCMFSSYSLSLTVRLIMDTASSLVTLNSEKHRLCPGTPLKIISAYFQICILVYLKQLFQDPPSAHYKQNHDKLICGVTISMLIHHLSYSTCSLTS
jgi:hypothetical protein